MLPAATEGAGRQVLLVGTGNVGLGVALFSSTHSAQDSGSLQMLIAHPMGASSFGGVLLFMSRLLGEVIVGLSPSSSSAKQVASLRKVLFVNGMGAEVLAIGRNGMFVRTDQGRVLMVHQWTNEGGVTVYPFRLGYASTLHKVQGATLPHITLWMFPSFCKE